MEMIMRMKDRARRDIEEDNNVAQLQSINIHLYAMNMFQISITLITIVFIYFKNENIWEIYENSDIQTK